MDELENFSDHGYIVIPDFIDQQAADNLKIELQIAIEEEGRLTDQITGSERPDQNMVHNCFLHGKQMFNLLNLPELRYWTNTLLCPNAIVYAYQSSSAPPESTNFGNRIHVDSPRFVPDYATNLGFILALDDFTETNGATEVMPGSHRQREQPTIAEFNEARVMLTCKKGSAVFFNARLWHRTGVNLTKSWRHALTINFCRPYMRTRFDFPRMRRLEELGCDHNSEAAKYLGWNVRMPTSLEEFYSPIETRLYKPNQE